MIKVDIENVGLVAIIHHSQIDRPGVLCSGLYWTIRLVDIVATKIRYYSLFKTVNNVTTSIKVGGLQGMKTNGIIKRSYKRKKEMFT